MMQKRKILILSGIAVLVIFIIGLLVIKNGDDTNTYKVTFLSNGGTIVEDQNVEEGSMVTRPTNPTKDGYEFIEWQLDGKTYDFSIKVEKDLTLKAIWKEVTVASKEFTITFDSDGGSMVINQKVQENGLVTEPINPTKQGYTFIEWQLNNASFDFNTKVTQDITLKAVWAEETKKSYTVTFDTDGGNTIASKTVLENAKVSKPKNPTKKGYEFVEWLLDGKAYNFKTKVTKDITLKAKWQVEKAKYTVTFDTNGGSSVSSQTITEGQKITDIPKPTRSGYTFVEWQLNNQKYDFSTPITSNIKLVAKWQEVTKNTYTVTFDSKGGQNVASQSIVEGNKVSKPTDPTKEGYKFAGWLLNDKTYDFNNPVNGNIKLTAKWEAKVYTIKALAVDDYSPARILKVYEDGKEISVKTIKYSDGATLCSGENPNVNKNVLTGETTFKVVLNSGTEVTATLK